MNKFIKIIFIFVSIALLVYVSFPTPEYPNPPVGIIQSIEPGDMEDENRRGYYTNLTRAEIIAHYEAEFNKNINLYTLRLNYPPEESQTIIRDQTKSTYLEELVHPLRESVYISGFEAEKTIYELKINGETWKQKIIIKYVPSDIFARIIVIMLAMSAFYFLVKEYLNAKKN